jgi:hypothetical protein
MNETVSRSASAGMNRPGRASARGQGPAGGWIDLVSSTTSRRSLWPAPSTHSGEQSNVRVYRSVGMGLQRRLSLCCS